MAKRKNTSLYFADNKDISDFLLSAKKKLPTPKLKEIARKRGIFFSNTDGREDIIAALSRLPFSWPAFEALVNAAEAAHRHEKMTSSTVETPATQESIRETLRLLAEQRAVVENESISVAVADGTITATVRYTEIDTTKTRLHQKTQREAVIEISREANNTFKIRHEALDRCDRIVKDLIHRLGEDQPDETRHRQIRVSDLAIAQHRTEFFLSLIRGVQGYRAEDVKSVRVHRTDDDLNDHDDDDGEPNETLPPTQGEDDDDLAGVVGSEAEVLAGELKSAALQGDGLTYSPQYQALIQEGFFISKVVWIAAPVGTTGPKIRIEAEFADDDRMGGFRYSIRGLQDRKEDSEDFKVAFRPPRPEERKMLGILVERAAEASLAQLLLLQQQQQGANPP